jgi:hypothetical protein
MTNEVEVTDEILNHYIKLNCEQITKPVCEECSTSTETIYHDTLAGKHLCVGCLKIDLSFDEGAVKETKNDLFRKDTQSVTIESECQICLNPDECTGTDCHIEEEN